MTDKYFTSWLWHSSNVVTINWLKMIKLPINHHKINYLSQSKVKSNRKEYSTESKFPFFFLIIFLVSTLNVDFPLKLVLLGQQAEKRSKMHFRKLQSWNYWQLSSQRIININKVTIRLSVCLSPFFHIKLLINASLK